MTITSTCLSRIQDALKIVFFCAACISLCEWSHAQSAVDDAIQAEQVTACYYRALSLHPGWNLIAVDDGLLNNLVSAVLGEHITGLVWKWDAASANYVESTTLEPGSGYWVYYSSPAAETRSEIESVQIPLLFVRTDSPPDAKPDRTFTTAGVPVTVNVLENDVAPGTEPLHLVYCSAPLAGEAHIEGNSVVYTPGPEFDGEDLFWYAVSDPHGNAAIADVIISANVPPEAADDSVRTPRDTAVQIDLLANDWDPDNDPLSIVSITAPESGSVTEHGDGTITYTPPASFSGVVVFSYVLGDGNGGTDTAEISIRVNAIPVAAADTVATQEATPVQLSPLANDSDADGDGLSLTGITVHPSNGQVELHGDGTLTYTPNTDFHGNDQFSYSVSDGHGGTDTATVTVTVNGRPQAVADTAFTNQAEPVTISVLDNDSDPDGHPLQLSSLTTPGHGSAEISNDSMAVTYSPDEGFHGEDSFVYTVEDGRGGTASAQVTVTVNGRPIPVDDTAAVNQGDAVIIDLLANDSDPEDDNLMLTGFDDGGLRGSLQDHGDGTVTYTPNPEFYGTDTFTYIVADSHGAESPGSVSIDVNGRPLANNDEAVAIVGDAVLIDLLANDSDPEGKMLTVQMLGTPAHGTLQDHGDGTVTYTPEPEYAGPDSFSYTIADPEGATASDDVTVTVTVNHPPTVVDDAASAPAGDDIVIQVLANDSDPDGHTLSLIEAGVPPHGTVQLQGDGTLVYSPALGWVGLDTFSYTVSDGHGGAATGSVTVSVGNVTGLQISGVRHSYSSPYLLDFSLSLRDQDNHAVVVDPRQITVECFEDGTAISPSETGYQLVRGSNKQLKCVLVLDYTNSMADVFSNGDSDEDGISDAVETMETAAKAFIDALNPDVQVALYEFHRDDRDPALVQDFTSNRDALKDEIDSIWNDYVQWFPAGSRCWDAVYAAIDRFTGSSSADEERYVVFLSDGRDESSSHTPASITSNANSKGAKVYCIGFGAELDPAPLQSITSSTGGQYYTAGSIEALTTSFQQIIYDLQGQYILRWATLKRSESAFTPSFVLSAMGVTDEHSGEDYQPTAHDGDVLEGSLRFVVDPVEDGATKLILRSSYTPRYIRRFRFYYHTNLPHTVSLIPESQEGLCADWTLTTTPDDVGGVWLELESSNPSNPYTAIPFASMGPILRFDVENIESIGTIFNNLELDNSIYAQTGGQWFTFANHEDFCIFNQPPTPSDDSALTNKDISVEIDVLTNDSDPQGHALTVFTVTDSANGTTEITGNGTKVTYTPDTGFSGMDSFSYTADDGHGGQNSADVAVTVNAAPDAVADSAATAWQTWVAIEVLSNDTDADNDDLTVSAVTQGANGNVTIEGGGEVVVYTPAAGWLGEDSFTYTVTDEHGASATANVTVTTVNQSPAAYDDTFACTNEGDSVEIDILANDSDPDGHTLTVVAVTDPANGAAEITGDGTTVTYTPGAAFISTDTFTYTVEDGHGGQDTASVTVTFAGDPNAETRERVNDRWVRNTYADGAVTMSDIETGLMWLYDASYAVHSWQAAIDHCNHLVYAGYDNWSLPYLGGLYDMYDQQGYFYGVMHHEGYWFSDDVWQMSMSDGHVYHSESDFGFVWPCRVGQ